MEAKPVFDDNFCQSIAIRAGQGARYNLICDNSLRDYCVAATLNNEILGNFRLTSPKRRSQHWLAQIYGYS
jgi:hypothetical protein